jgi:hypothetical protein
MNKSSLQVIPLKVSDQLFFSHVVVAAGFFYGFVVVIFLKENCLDFV